MHKFLLLISIIVLLAGCRFYDPKRVEDDFGVSVRQMVQEQIYAPEVGQNPALAGPDRLDGPAAIRTLEQYKDTSNKASANPVSTGTVVSQ